MAWIGPVIGAAADIIGQSQANSANKNLNQQNMIFQERMANSAVTRRMNDLRIAGLNPALAVAGQGAPTPQTAPAEMESTTRDAGQMLGAAANTAIQASQAKANIALTQASTAKELALAKSANVEADIAQKTSGLKTEYTANQYVEGVEQNDLTTAIMRTKRDMTTAELKQFETLLPTVVQEARQEAALGKINLEQLQKFVSLAGGQVAKWTPILQALMGTLSTMARGAK